MAFKHGAGVGVIELDNAAGAVVDVSQYIQNANPEVKRETSDSTALPDVAKKFLQGLEDGGEMQVVFMMTSATPCPIWQQVAALYNAPGTSATFAAYPAGKATNKAKMSREVEIVGMGLPVQTDDGIKFPATLKAQGATSIGVV